MTKTIPEKTLAAKTSKKKQKRVTSASRKAKTATKSLSKIAKRTPTQARLIRETTNAILATNSKIEAIELLGINASSFYRRLQNYPEIQKGIEFGLTQVKQDAIRRIKSSAETYVIDIQRLAKESNSDNVKLSANLELLDRAGIQKPQTTNNIQVNVLNELKKQSNDYDL